ncbi:MAG: DUF364 domain-containing protein [Acidobacteria bacterium]|nr:DUF364 domain-containing protein [Acidobacteriota bacterium]
MNVIESLIESTRAVPVRRVLAGCFNTVVQSSGWGIASTLKPLSQRHEAVPGAGTLVGRNVKELAALARSDNSLAASVGIAAINSALETAALPLKELNARELLVEKGKGGVLGMIGHFPFIERVRNLFSGALVFELNPQKGDLPAEEIRKRLKEADVVAITATSLINHSFDEIISSCRKDSYRVLLGPSTPLTPLLFQFGIDAVSGSIVTDPDTFLPMAAEGTPFRKLAGISHVTLLKEDMN